MKRRSLLLIGLAAVLVPAMSLPAAAEPAQPAATAATADAPPGGVTAFHHDHRWDGDDDRWKDDKGRRGRWDRDRRCRYRYWCGPYAEGFRDGYREGRRDGDRGCRWDPDRRRGPDRYRRGYIDGYRAGFRDECRW